MMVVGGGFMAPYYSILSDMLTGDLIGVVVAFEKVCSIGLQYFFSLTFKKEAGSTSYWLPSMIFSITSLVSGLLVASLFFETYGLTKVQIFERLSSRSKSKISNKKMFESTAVIDS